MSIVYTSKSDRLDRMMDSLAANTDITDFTPGTIARGFLDIVNEELEECYTTLDRYITMAFLSSATGRFLDLLGALLDCARQTNETDDNYRYRISQQVYVTAGANETTIRLKCLSVSGVNDVVIKPYTYGIGSFSVYVLTDEEDDDAVVTAVQAVLDEEKACGIKAVATLPTYTPIDITIKLYLKSTVGSIEASGITYDARTAVKQYIDNLSMGEMLSTSKIVTKAMDVNEKITHAEVVELKINSKLTYFTTYTPAWDEKVTVNTLTVK